MTFNKAATSVMAISNVSNLNLRDHFIQGRADARARQRTGLQYGTNKADRNPLSCQPKPANFFASVQSHRSITGRLDKNLLRDTCLKTESAYLGGGLNHVKRH